MSAGAHVIHLGSYVDYQKGSEQYAWLEQDLANFSRRHTPFLIANLHAPFYHTYIAVSARPLHVQHSSLTTNQL